MRVDATALTRFARDLLVAAGLRPDDADVVAASLVAADLRGVGSHGVLRLPIYVERIRLGLVATDPVIEVRRTGPATAVVDGGNGPGQVVATRAMREAIALAREAGAGFASARHSNHFGAAGWFAMQAAEAGMVGIALTHCEADVLPYGGARAALGTNPIAVAAPRAGAPPLLVDMATSAVARGKISLAASEGRSIPGDWAVDADGQATTDPAAVRAVRPMAGPKGYGLAVVVEILAGLLSGSRTGVEIRRMYDDFTAPHDVGHFLGAIDVARFVPLDAFTAALDGLAAQLRSVPPASGFDEVLLPGEPEERNEARNRRDGVPIHDELHRDLLALGESLGVAWPA
jgi:ureidoglycolate dehydrogenase (NAD+)